MATVAIQVVIGEAGAGHQPRGLADNLGGIGIGVSEDTVEHLSVTSLELADAAEISQRRAFKPDNGTDVVSGKHVSERVSKSVGNHIERHFVGSQSTEVGLVLSIGVSLYQGVIKPIPDR